MRAQELLQELADNPYKYVQTKRTSEGDEYYFQTESGGYYRVVVKKHWYAADAIRRPPTVKELEIGFAYVDPKTDTQTIDVTGTGHAFRVLATIKSIVNQYLERLEPEFISFNGKSKDASRISLYRRIANSAPRWLPNYSKESESSDADSFYFRLIRN